MNNNEFLIDGERSVWLRDQGLASYVAGTVIGPDGAQQFVLIEIDRVLVDSDFAYDQHCSQVQHEQLEPLSIYEWERIHGIGRWSAE